MPEAERSTNPIAPRFAAWLRSLPVFSVKPEIPIITPTKTGVTQPVFLIAMPPPGNHSPTGIINTSSVKNQ